MVRKAGKQDLEILANLAVQLWDENSVSGLIAEFSEMISKEPLNKSSAAVSGSFPPTLRYRKREIHAVFRRFQYLDWPKNLLLTALADLIRASLTVNPNSF